MAESETSPEGVGLPSPAISEERVALGAAVQARADEVGRLVGGKFAESVLISAIARASPARSERVIALAQRRDNIGERLQGTNEAVNQRSGHQRKVN